MTSKVDEEGSATVALHRRETSASGYWGHPGICTVTFCEGDASAAFEALRRRLAVVVNANPWMAGRLIAKKLVHPLKGSEALVHEIISLHEANAAVSRSRPYADLVKATGANPSLAVQSGKKLQATRARVSKLSVVKTSSEGEFALVFSMSHVVADGHDYYKIYNMVAGSAPVEALDATRFSEYEAREPEWTGPKDFGWLSGFGLLKGMLGGLLCGPKSSWCCFYVDEAKVATAKAAAAAAGTAAFVSTNDVLTSHFCQAARARVGMMVINMRGKIPLGITDLHAGCYEGCLLLDPLNYHEPAAIRACLAAGMPYTRQARSPALPGACQACPMALITSWASFPFDLSLEGVGRQLLHLPCMAMPDVMDVCVAFKPQPGRLAMLYLAKRAKPNRLTRPHDTVLGATVDEGLFPLGR